jgi:hypothetical protein
VEVVWEWQRLGWFRGVVDGLVVAQVVLESDQDGTDSGWMVYLLGRSVALDGRHPTEFDAMASAEAALFRSGSGSSGYEETKSHESDE